MTTKESAREGTSDVQHERESTAEQVDAFLYPGPRPLGRGDSQLLVGRDKDVARLVYQVYNYPIVEITAPSGTGKSSILAAGVIPSLEQYGFRVVTLRSWADVRGSHADYFYHAIRQAFVDSGADQSELDEWPEGAQEGIPWVAEHFEGSLVVIFDQLEELMRVDAPKANEFLVQVVRLARESSIRQILSLRAEYKAQLSVVESQLAITQWQWYRLGEIADEYVPGVIQAPRSLATTDSGDDWPISDEVLKVLVDSWQAAKDAESSIGLLHLQATLWVLEAEIGGADVPWNTEAAVQSPLYETLLQETPTDRAQAVASALLSYVQLAMAQLERSTNLPHNPWAGAETRYAVARFVDDLSSAGYKIPMSVDDLFLRCYEGLQDLRADQDRVRKLRRIWEGNKVISSGDPVEPRARSTVDRPSVISSGDPVELFRVAEEHVSAWGRNATDPLVLRERFFSGRLWKFDALAGLCELEVIFERALSWLENRGIVRITPDSKRVRLVTLIHDGFGAALNEWAQAVTREPDYYLRALVGENGTSVLGGQSETDRLRVPDREGHEVARALQWSGCSVDFTDFRNIVFEDCDLRGTIFFQCRFQDVQFRNCYMPGALFIEPTVAGLSGLLFSDTITRTLSIMGGQADEAAPLVFDAVEEVDRDSLPNPDEQWPGADGLFLESYAGSWEITNSRFNHLSVIRCGPGAIRKSDLSLIQVDELPGPVTVEKSRLRHVLSGAMPDGETVFLAPRSKP